MSSKYYAVTNNNDGSICLAGRVWVEIPGKCAGHIIKLPAATAGDTIARLKQAYPFLKIVPAEAPVADGGTAAPKVDAKVETKVEVGKSDKKADDKTADRK